MKKLIGLVAIIAVVYTLIGYWWSIPPRDNLVIDLPENAVAGHETTQALIETANAIINKPGTFKGGYISNDRNPLLPGFYIDNIKSWEYGVLIQVRDTAAEMRNGFGKPRSQGEENDFLAKADPKFQSDNMYWLFPEAESVYLEGIEFLEKYRDQLSDQNKASAQFYTRADNLEEWLGIVSTRLGDYSQKLSNSREKLNINVDLAGDSVATQSTPTQEQTTEKTPWTQLDNNFYEAQGYAWATVQVMRAMAVDFEDVLKDKNALPNFLQILEDLQETQKPIYSPMILNGSGNGFWANHSLWLANYISRANAGVIDIRDLLNRG
ncbi:MAG: DUF2333 family protein [Pseudomonadota bacterium]|nr:DUF2333 family protein [Pseudomonadota bacterium]